MLEFSVLTKELGMKFDVYFIGMALLVLVMCFWEAVGGCSGAGCSRKT